MIDENKKLAKQLKSAPAQSGGTNFLDKARQLLAEAETIGTTVLVISKIDQVPIDQARAAIDIIKTKAASAVVVFGMAEGDDKVTLLAAVTDDLIPKGLKAGDLVKEIAPIVSGAGGGRPQMAQAGGKDPSKLDDALARAAEIIKAKLRK